MQLLSIAVNNYVTYKKKTKLSLNKNSVIVIRGKNLDRRDRNSSNGAGKSTLVSTLPQLLFNETPLPIKSKKNPREGFFKDSYHIFEFRDSLKNIFTVKKYFKGTTRLQIIKNGKDLNFRDSSLKDSSEARLYLKTILPFTEEQFYSLYYFDIKRSSVLQFGTDTQRHKFIENLFNLNIYDAIAQDIKKDWDKSKISIQELEILERQKLEKTKALPNNVKILKRKYEFYKTKVELLRAKVKDLLKRKDQCKTFIVLSSDIKEHKDLTHEIKEQERTLNKIKQEYNKLLSNNKSYESSQEIKQNRENLNRKLVDLSDITIDKSINTHIANLKYDLDKSQKISKENSIIRDRIKSIEIQIKYLENKLLKYNNKQIKQASENSLNKITKSADKESYVLKDLKSNLKDTQDHLTSHSNQECPVCSTILDTKTLKQVIANKLKNIDQSENRLSKLLSLKELKKLLNEEKELRQEKVDLEKSMKPEVDFNKIKKNLDKNEILLGLMKKKVILKAKLSELPKTHNHEYTDLSPILKNLESNESKLVYLRDQSNKINQLNKLDLPIKSNTDANETLDKINKMLVEYEPILEKLQEKFSRLSVELNKAKSLEEDLSELNSRIAELKTIVPDFKIQSVLRKAFGSKGIRKQRVAEIGFALQATLNKYADQVFDFKIEFEFIITDTKFQILAKRNNKVADVKTLSGAESRYFTLLLMITLLKFIPIQNRLSCVFLDEAEASLDKAFRDKLINNFLPLLKELVSTVVFITPTSSFEMFVPNAINYTVIKDKGVSVLTKQ